MNGLSKRLVSLTMATAMVFSLTAVPATEAKAAKASITSKTTSVQAGKTYTYKIKASKAKKVKVSVSGTAAKAVRVNGKKATSGITLKGGKTVTVKVKVNPSKTVAGKKFTINYKLDKKKAVKTKSIKVNYSTKGVTLDQTALTMKAGETATLKATMTTVGTNSKIKDWSSSNEAVATVKDGVVTAVAAGTADITVKTSNGKTATAKVTVEDTEKKPEAFTLTADATKADTITGTLSREVAADATVTVMKEGLTTAVDGKATITGTTVEFKGTANFTKGTYTITVKEGELSADAKVTVQDEYVADIIIKSEAALTGNARHGVAQISGEADNSYAYIYYDVVNQYGESLKSSTTIEWTTSASKVAVDKSTGCITVRNGDAGNAKAFTYGSQIFVTGVYAKTGVSVSKAVTVGMPQSLDSVKAVYFVDKNRPSVALTSLPADFSENTYYMLYEVYDQEGNTLAAKNNYVGNGVTLVSDQPLLLDFDTTMQAVYTIDGVEYSAIMVKPGMYTDKGGEVNITAISTKTGNKKSANFVIGDNVVLESLELSAPAGVVADGDWVEIPYVAKDTKGNAITNYEAIVRSSNTLNLTASAGTLGIRENNDGTAQVYWTDDSLYKARDYDDLGNAILHKTGFEPATTQDGVDRPIALTTVVVGGTSNNMVLSVSDKRIPVAIKSVKINEGADALVNGAQAGANFNSKDVYYLDQYGASMDGTVAKEFFDYSYNTGYTSNGTKYIYGVYVDGTRTYTEVNSQEDDVIYSGRYALTLSSISTAAAINNDTVKYSIGQIKFADKAYVTTLAKWDKAGKTFSVQYANVPVAKLGSVSFKWVDKKQVAITGMDNQKTGAQNGLNTLSGNSLNIANAIPVGNFGFVNGYCEVKVAGIYNGKTLEIPSQYVTVMEDKFAVSNPNNQGAALYLTGISGNSLHYSDLYDANTAQFTRKDASLKLKAKVFTSASKTDLKPIEISTDIKMADAAPAVDKLYFTQGEKAIVRGNGTDVTFKTFKNGHYDDFNGEENELYTNPQWWAQSYGLVVLDQYGNNLHNDPSFEIIYTVTDLKENEGAFAHVLENLSVTGNGTAGAGLEGAELGDTFKLTATVNGVSATVDVTMGSDKQAYVTDDYNADKPFRTGKLAYAR